MPLKSNIKLKKKAIFKVIDDIGLHVILKDNNEADNYFNNQYLCVH